jgi:hypothetical protein
MVSSEIIMRNVKNIDKSMAGIELINISGIKQYL